MKEDSHNPSIEPELEARIIAFVLGEASDFEEAELNRLIAERPELTAFQREMQHLHGMLKEVGSGESEPKGEWKLPADRRNKVLSVIQGEAAPEAERTVQPAVQRNDSTSQRVWFGLPRTVTATICSIAVCGFLVLQSVFWRNERAANVSFSGTAKEPEGVEMVAGTVMTFERDYGSLAPETVPTGGPGKFTDTPNATELDAYGFLPLPKKEADHKVNSSSSLDAIRNTLKNDFKSSTTYLDDDVQFFDADDSLLPSVEEMREYSRIARPSMPAQPDSGVIVESQRTKEELLRSQEKESDDFLAMLDSPDPLDAVDEISEFIVDNERPTDVTRALKEPRKDHDSNDREFADLKYEQAFGEFDYKGTVDAPKAADAKTRNEHWGFQRSEAGEALLGASIETDESLQRPTVTDTNSINFGLADASKNGLPTEGHSAPRRYEDSDGDGLNDVVPYVGRGGYSGGFGGGTSGGFGGGFGGGGRFGGGGYGGGLEELLKGALLADNNFDDEERIKPNNGRDLGSLYGTANGQSDRSLGELADPLIADSESSGKAQIGTNEPAEIRFNESKMKKRHLLELPIIEGFNGHYKPKQDWIPKSRVRGDADGNAKSGTGVDTSTVLGDVSVKNMPDLGISILKGNEADVAETENVITQLERGRNLEELVQMSDGDLAVVNPEVAGQNSDGEDSTGTNNSGLQDRTLNSYAIVENQEQLNRRLRFRSDSKQPQFFNLYSTESENRYENVELSEITATLERNRGRGASAGQQSSEGRQDEQRIAGEQGTSLQQGRATGAVENQKSREKLWMSIPELPAVTVPHSERGEERKSREIAKKKGQSPPEQSTEDHPNDMITGLTTRGRSTAREYWEKQSSDSPGAKSDWGREKEPVSDSEDVSSFRTQPSARKERPESVALMGEAEPVDGVERRPIEWFDASGKIVTEAGSDNPADKKSQQQSDVVNVEDFEYESFANSTDGLDHFSLEIQKKQKANSDEKAKARILTREREKLIKKRADDKLQIFSDVDESFANVDYTIPDRWSELLPKEKTAESESKFIEGDRPSLYDVQNQTEEPSTGNSKPASVEDDFRESGFDGVEIEWFANMLGDNGGAPIDFDFNIQDAESASKLYARSKRYPIIRDFSKRTLRLPQSLSRQSRIAPPAGLNETPTTKETFSTFSLHVSDVSFKLAQAALARGEWPDAKKVRVEEFVNAFDYGDPLPGTDEQVACRMEQSIHPFLQQRNVLRIAMRTGAAGRASNVPLRLTFLLDNSGSMERVDRQQTVRRAFAMLAQQLTPIDKVTVISFARQPRLLADRISGNEAAKLVQLIDKLPSEGGTNVEAGLLLAFEKAIEQQTTGAQSRVVLLTDGAVNLGDADPESLSRTVMAMRDSGIAFDAAGIVADGLNDEVLEALTRKGDGRYYLLDSPESAEDGFARQIAGALRPSAKNVKVQVEFNPKRVARFKLLGFEKHVLKKEDFRNDKVDAAEMAAEEAGVAMYQFEALPDGEGDIGSVSVRFRDLSSGQMVENRWPIPYEAGAPRPDLAAPSLRIAMSAAMLAAKLRGESLGETVNLQTLSQLVSGLPDEERGTVRVQQLQRMIERARQLSDK